MGKSNFHKDKYFKGAIDGFRIYERVLKPSEAKCLGDKNNCTNYIVFCLIPLFMYMNNF